MNRLRNMLIAAGVCSFVLTNCSANEHEQSEYGAEPVEKIYTSAPETKEVVNNGVTNSRMNAITEAVKRCSPAVVGINVTEVRQMTVRDPFEDFFGSNPLFEQFFRRNRRVYNQEIRGLGSGFLISSDGYILTNDHVAGTATKIVVTLTNGEKYDAEIIGTDKTSDVALLKIDGKNLPYLPLANSDEVITGEWVIALGNPFGLFDINSKPTITVGVVSNTGVNFSEEGRVYRDMIQTDAAISSGNSGGPIVNALGEAIGMNTIIFSTAQNSRGAGSIGIGYAIPINRVKRIVDLIKAHKKIDREFDPGFYIQEIDDRIAKSYGLEKKQGVVVVQVKRGSSADQAGLEPGDIVLEADGKKVLREEDLQVVIGDCVAGQTISLSILRNDETIVKKLKMLKPKN